MKYITAIKGSLLTLPLFVLMVIFIPIAESPDNVGTILSVSTFLFGILAGFFISRLNNRYDQIREFVSSEDAYWLSFFKIAEEFGQDFSKKISKLIDKYYIMALDFGIKQYYKHNLKYFIAVFDEINAIKDEKGGDNLFDDLTDSLANIEQVRNKSAVLITEKLTIGQWLVLIFLALVILGSIFVLRGPTFYFDIIAVVFGVVLVLVLLVLRDLQNLRLGGKIIAGESAQEVLEIVGGFRYYPQKYVEKGVLEIPKEVRKYRLGLHAPGEEENIKLVEK